MDYDQDTIELAMPKYDRVKESLEFYKKQVTRLAEMVEKFPIASKLERKNETEQQKLERESIEIEFERLEGQLDEMTRKRDFIDGLKAEIECRWKKFKRMEVQKDKQPATIGIFEKPTSSKWTKSEKDEDEKKIPKFDSFKPYSSALELPLRRKFDETLELQRQLLKMVSNEVSSEFRINIL